MAQLKQVTKPATKPVAKKGKTLEELHAIGVALAESFVSSDLQSSVTKREALLTSAVEANDKEKSQAILNAYTETLRKRDYTESVVRVRKAEANTVFKAVHATKVNLRTLQEFKGNYNEFIQLARNLIPAKPVNATAGGEPSVTRERRAMKISDKQVEVVDKSIERASASQLADIVDTASVQIQKIVAPKMASLQSLILINSIADKIIRNTFAEDYEKEVGQKIFDLSQEAIDRLNKVMHDSATSLETVKSKDAVTQKPVVEVQKEAVE